MTEHRDHDEDLEVLPPATRILLLVLGSLLLLLGLVGLALPVIPQTIPLALGAAVLSLASKRVERLLLRGLARWPRIAGGMRGLRRRVHGWLRPRRGRGDSP